MESSFATALGIALVMGLGAGIVAGWLLARARAQATLLQERNEGAVHQAQLGERLAAAEKTLVARDSDRLAADEALAGVRTRLDKIRDEAARSESDLRQKLGAAQSTVAAQADILDKTRAELAEARERRDAIEGKSSQATARIAELNSELESERRHMEDKLVLLEQAKEELSARFKALANDILEEKSKRFTEQNQANLGALLDPLRTRLQEFQGKVEEVYVNEGKDRSALAEQVKQLMALNQQLSQDAHNLTSALKGQVKTQGNWGEVILERVLESSGLVKGLHYDAQASHAREDGSRAQPDIVIRLPEGKNLVVDAKVSLTAYEQYASAEDQSAREQALKRHLDSVRAHIKGLSAKNYQQIYELKSIDFVLMFVPIEPAFMLAVAQDPELWREAWAKNVLLVSPSTTLFVLRTVAHLWRQEQQSRNAQDIARRGAELYDKLAGFVDDLNKVGKGLDAAKASYDDAYAKLATGRGNVIRQAELLKDLGVKPTKGLPQVLVDLSAPKESIEPSSEKAA